MIELILRGITHVISNQEKMMADLASVQTAVANLSTAVQALEAKQQSAPPSVLQSDLDPVVQGLDTLTASVNALLNPPAGA